MRGILCSYRETKRQTVKRKEKLENERRKFEDEKGLGIKELKRLAVESEGVRTLEIENIERSIYLVKQEIYRVEHDIEIMNAAISDAKFVIKWISTGRMPGTTRGMERQSAYKREIAFDGKWLDLLADEDVELHELPEPDKEEQQMKVDLVTDLKEYLTPRQLEVFVMLGEGMEQTAIAEMLGISKQAVNEMVTRGRRKIKDAGWILV